MKSLKLNILFQLIESGLIKVCKKDLMNVEFWILQNKKKKEKLFFIKASNKKKKSMFNLNLVFLKIWRCVNPFFMSTFSFQEVLDKLPFVIEGPGQLGATFILFSSRNNFSWGSGGEKKTFFFSLRLFYGGWSLQQIQNWSVSSSFK